MKLRRPATILLTAALLAAACTSSSKSSSPTSNVSGLGDPGNCVSVDVTVSPEKFDLITSLAKQFNGSKDATSDGQCVFVRPQSKSSGAATTLLGSTWDEGSDGPRPVVWSPASSSWGGILNQRLSDQGKQAMVGSAKPFMLTPLTIAMPQPMASALGYPDKPVGWSDILRLARDKKGWAAFGHPEWGPFRLGKTNPNFSTSGLSGLISQTYAATGKTSGLTAEDIDSPKNDTFAKGVESAVVHYGDTTLTFLNNWFRTDRQGTSLQYASAVAVEEKSVIDYNRGNPDGVLQPGERARKPRIPLVAIYPKEGTLFSDNPFIILDAPWVDSKERKAAAVFQTFVQRPSNQRKVLDFGFRPGNPDVAVGSPIVTGNGVDPKQPQTLFEVPKSAVLVKLLNKWQTQRKSARVLLVLDVSGSMKEAADKDNPDGPTKLDLAKKAAIEALGQFKPEDEVGLRIFTTGLGPSEDKDFLDLLPVEPIGPRREALASRIRDQFPLNATPLYTVAQRSYESARAAYDPTRINAVVLLTDGKNDDDNRDDDDRQLQTLLSILRRGSEGEGSKPIRVFPIAYGRDADLDTLRTIAEATNSAVYDASDPTTITKVFTAVVSNF